MNSHASTVGSVTAYATPNSSTITVDISNEVQHAVHCMLYAPTEKEIRIESKAEDMTQLRAIVLMHLRFDGMIGFAGGMVDNPVTGLGEEEFHQELVEALRRELLEEIGMSEALRARLTPQNYLFESEIVRANGAKLVLHFFGLKLSLSEITELEVAAHRCEDYGLEVLGNIRVPLYTMHDGYRGFPAFLRNSFAGTARQQLLTGLERLGIMLKSEIDEAVDSSNQSQSLKAS